MAFRLSKYPFEKLWLLFGQMLFPAFVTFSDDNARVIKNFIKVSKLGVFVLWPLLFVLILTSDFIVPFLLGTKWIAAIGVIKVFCAYLLAQSATFSCESILMSKGLIKKANSAKLLSLFVLAVLGFIGTKYYATIGMSWAFTIATIFYICVILCATLKSLELNLSSYLRSFGILPLLYLLSLALLVLKVFSLKGWIFFFICAFYIAVVTVVYAQKKKIIVMKKPFVLLDNL